MKKDNNKSIRRERIIMVTSSVFVLAALTMTGVYMGKQPKESKDDGYTIDFSALENRADDKLKEIVEKNQVADREALQEELPNSSAQADSKDIKLPGLTGRKTVDESNGQSMSEGAGQKTQPQKTKEPAKQKQSWQEQQAVAPEEEVKEQAAEESSGGDAVETGMNSPVIADDLHFNAAAMIKPVVGDALIPYSMAGTVYFPTLDQYKYNPAVIYAAKQGDSVGACCAGRVVNIHDDPELGHVLVLDLGDGYQAVYGQLQNIEVPIGAAVEAGMKLAEIAGPTRYYSVEGSNLYFQLTKDGSSIDPGQFF